MSRFYRENPEEPIRHDWLEGPQAGMSTGIPVDLASQAASALGKLGRGHKKTLTAEQRESKRVLMVKINAKRKGFS